MVEARVERSELIGLERVQLAPVWAALVFCDDRLERCEVAPMVDLEVVVNSDVSGFALMRGREPDVVGGSDADLYRNRDSFIVIIEVPAALAPPLREGSRARTL
jgi:hypothetical protein